VEGEFTAIFKRIFPHLGIWVGDFLILTLCVFFLLRLENTWRELKISLLLLVYIISFLFFPLFLPRKHIELKLAQLFPSFLFIAGVVQMHNNLYEEAAKLLAILAAIFLSGGRLREPLERKGAGILIGLWGGVGYGVGEALTLTLIAYKPELGKIFGVSLLWLFVTWNWVFERFLAILVHGIMGAFVGHGLHHFLKSRNWKKFLFFFILALFYHELVDGTVLYLAYFPTQPIAKLIKGSFLYLVLPIYVLIGAISIFVLYRLQKGGEHVRGSLSHGGGCFLAAEANRNSR